MLLLAILAASKKTLKGRPVEPILRERLAFDSAMAALDALPPQIITTTGQDACMRYAVSVQVDPIKLSTQNTIDTIQDLAAQLPLVAFALGRAQRTGRCHHIKLIQVNLEAIELDLDDLVKHTTLMHIQTSKLLAAVDTSLNNVQLCCRESPRQLIRYLHFIHRGVAEVSACATVQTQLQRTERAVSAIYLLVSQRRPLYSAAAVNIKPLLEDVRSLEPNLWWQCQENAISMVVERFERLLTEDLHAKGVVQSLRVLAGYQ